MEDINEDGVIMYEESKEIEETIWKIWDLMNDKEIVTKLLASSTLINELEKSQSHYNLSINANNFFKDKFAISIEDIQYGFHLKIITYKIESSLFFNKNIDKSINSENKINLPERNSNNRQNDSSNYIKCIFTLQPNTLEETKLLTISMIDFSGILNEDQLKSIIKSIFNNFNDTIVNPIDDLTKNNQEIQKNQVKEVPLTKSCESIIINANINIVFDFWQYWKLRYLDDKIVRNYKIDGEPNKVGSKIDFIFLDKLLVASEILEINKFFQEGNEDDNNEWNYKYRVIYEDGEIETFNVIFISCENGTKTYISLENKINEKIKIKSLTDYSNRKLTLLNSIKNFIENNKGF